MNIPSPRIARNKAAKAARPRRADPDAAPRQADAGPRSLLRTLRILERLASVPDGMTLAALSVALESPKSSLLGLLRPLCSYGYILHTEGAYVLGPAAYRLGVSIMPTLSMTRIAQPVMRELVEETQETVLVAVLDRAAGRVTYVEKIESSRSIRYTVPLGTSRPLYGSAAGRVLLAFSDQEYIERYLRTEQFEPYTPNTLTDPEELKRILAQVRREGLAITIGEISSDVAGFAAPIFDHQGRAIAALAMAAPISRTRSTSQVFATQVREAAESISFGFGYAPASLKVSATKELAGAHGSLARAARPANGKRKAA